jgi:7,8-dihydroneopterin aldolase/epimerase/oxygenase
MRIEIEDLTFETIIGVLDHERVHKQIVIVNLQLDYLYQTDYIDYVEVAKLIREDIISNQFYLLEDALRSLFILLPTRYPQMTRLFIKIAKPSAVADCTVSLCDTVSFS